MSRSNMKKLEVHNNAILTVDKLTAS